MKKAFFISLLFFCCITALFGQQINIDDWEGHFSYNNIKSVANGDGKIFVATENVLFTYDVLTNELETITTIEGLSGEYITTIHYSNNNNLIIIGYDSGLMEVYNLSTKTVLKVVDILNKTTISPEKIMFPPNVVASAHKMQIMKDKGKRSRKISPSKITIATFGSNTDFIPAKAVKKRMEVGRMHWCFKEYYKHGLYKTM